MIASGKLRVVMERVKEQNEAVEIRDVLRIEKGIKS
jgi:hypothetical protein